LIAAAALLVHALAKALTDPLAGLLALLGREVTHVVADALAHLGRDAAAAAGIAAAIATASTATTLRIALTARAARAALLCIITIAATTLRAGPGCAAAVIAIIRTIGHAALGATAFGCFAARCAFSAIAHAAFRPTIVVAIIGLAIPRPGFIAWAWARAWATIAARCGARFARAIGAGCIFGLGEARGGGKADCGCRGDHEAGNTSHWKAPVSCSGVERARRLAIARKCRGRGPFGS
jgi:hypothetical protein